MIKPFFSNHKKRLKFKEFYELLLLTCLLLKATTCYPHAIRLPDLENFSPPEEVNTLPQHNQYSRSIKSQNSANNLEATVKEVEELIKNDASLPRLTRGEILDILENITKADSEKLTSVEGIERDPKAIMVVMPYTPSNNEDNNMQDLFTKPPVTHIIGTEQSKENNSEESAENASFESYKRKPTREYKKRNEYKKPQIKESDMKEVVKLNKTSISLETSTSSQLVTITTLPTKYHDRNRIQKRRRRPSTTTTSTTSTITTETALITTYHPPRRPIRRRPTTTTPTPKYPNHKYPDDVTITKETIAVLPPDALNIINAPKLAPTQINYSLEDLEGQEDQQHNVVVEPDYFSKWNKKPAKSFSTPTPSIEIEVPEHLKKVVGDLNLLGINISEPNTSSKSEADKLKDILASIGAYVPPTTSTTTSTTTSIPDASSVVDNLSPEMRDLLMSFGLIPNPKENNKTKIASEYNPVKAEVKPDSYLGFKPLPDDSSARGEMEELLAQFGLGRNARKQKSITNKTSDSSSNDTDAITLDVVPEEFKAVLTDMGFDGKTARKIRDPGLDKKIEKQHVFNPAESQYATEEELEKLDKLLGFVKQLEKLNGSFTDEDLKHVDMKGLKELITSLTQNNSQILVPLDHQDAPDPNTFDFGLSKNEIKRQEETTVADIEKVTVTASTLSTEDSVPIGDINTPSIKLLEESFGGQTSTEAPAPETTTQAKKTGFYYLVDWNTFLDIDNQEGKRVNLRFQPKIGDPKRFFSVTVP